MSPDSFIFFAEIQIRFSDIDAMGHLNNATYLTYFESARIDFLSKVTPINWDEKKYGLIVARAEINYIAPVFLKDKIRVYVKTNRIGNKSFEVGYKMVKFLSDGTEKIVADGVTVLVAYDYETGKSMTLLDHWKTNLLQFEPHLNSLKS